MSMKVSVKTYVQNSGDVSENISAIISYYVDAFEETTVGISAETTVVNAV